MTAARRNALVIIVIATLLGSAFGLSFAVALDRPTPHGVPAGLVADPATRRAGAELQARTHGGLAFRRYPTRAAVEQAIDWQQIYAGIVPADPGARLLVASAAGSSVAHILEAAAAGTPIPVVDLRPLPAGDSAGLIPFYLVLAATVTGFVTMFQLADRASGLSLRAWFASIGALALVFGGVLTLLTGPAFGAQHGPLDAVWGALAGMVAVAALWGATMLVVAGIWTFIPTFGFLMVLGLPDNGGVVQPALQPPFYRFVYRFLPEGAAVQTVRNLLYFRGYQHAGPIIVLAAWVAGLAAVLLLVAWLKRQTPGGRPFHARKQPAPG
jgi:hypothetical protein